jgi:hypothetical protein
MLFITFHATADLGIQPYIILIVTHMCTLFDQQLIKVTMPTLFYSQKYTPKMKPPSNSHKYTYSMSRGGITKTQTVSWTYESRENLAPGVKVSVSKYDALQKFDSNGDGKSPCGDINRRSYHPWEAGEITVNEVRASSESSRSTQDRERRQS